MTNFWLFLNSCIKFKSLRKKIFHSREKYLTKWWNIMIWVSWFVFIFWCSIQIFISIFGNGDIWQQIQSFTNSYWLFSSFLPNFYQRALFAPVHSNINWYFILHFYTKHFYYPSSTYLPVFHYTFVKYLYLMQKIFYTQFLLANVQHWFKYINSRSST